MGLLRKEDIHESLLNSLSNPNLLINGDFQVWQRGKIFNYNGTNNSNIYTADRWRLIQSKEGATARVYKSSEIEENTLTISEFNKPSGIEMALSQKLDYSLQKEDGKRYTLSLLYSSTFNTEVCIREYDNDNTLGRKKMPASFAISRISFTFDSSKLSKKNNRVEIYINFGSEETYDNSQINLSNIKLEVGSVATSFSTRLYAEELALCKRYYEISNYDCLISGVKQNTSYITEYKYDVEKRVSPTIECGNTATKGQMYLFAPNNLKLVTPKNISPDTKKVRIEFPLQDNDQLNAGNACGVTGWIKVDAEIY